MSTISERIKAVVSMWAYDRGHSAGEDEVKSIENGMIWDLSNILEDIDELESRYKSTLLQEVHRSFSG